MLDKLMKVPGCLSIHPVHPNDGVAAELQHPRIPVEYTPDV